MFFLQWLRLIRGYIEFTATGGFPERFVNLCAMLRLPVWDVTPDSGGLKGKADPHAYLRIRAAARRAGMRLRIRQKKGLPFFLLRHRARFGLLIAAAVFLGTLGLLSAHIWVIHVPDADPWMQDAVRQTLYEVGVREGMRNRRFNASYAERALLLRMPELSWVALNRSGSVLHVKIRPAPTPLQTDDDTRPRHIVAAKDGYLRRLEAYEGKETTPLQTAVQKGQLLISGAVEHTDGSVTLLRADGYAEAETMRTIVCRQASPVRLPAVRRARKRIRLDLFSLRIPLGDPHPVPQALFYAYDCFASVGTMRLPLSCTVFRSVLFGEVQTLSAGQIKLLLDSDFGQQTAAALRECAILHAQIQRGAHSRSGTFRLLENIGAPQEILYEFSSEPPS